MKNSAKRNVIVSALLSIVMCISLIVGVTLAVVTSESKVNIAITGAKIDVVATVDENSIQQKQLNTDYSADGKTYSGEAEIVGGTVSLKNFVAGDGIKFNIIVKNNSTITVNYRTVLAVENNDGLLASLQMTIDGETYDGNTLYSKWQSVGVGDGDATITVAVELPENAANYQGKTCVLVFGVEAVQGNAEVDNFVAKIGETGYETLDEAVAALEEGDTLEITRPGIYAPFKITKANVTVKGIIGDSMATSTVIRNTATSNVKAYADGITLENLWIDSTTPQSIMWMNSGAVDPDVNPKSWMIFLINYAF